MTITEYAKAVAKIAKIHPNALVISSIDDEGNAYHPVYFTPSAGHFDGQDFDNDANVKNINAVCIN